MVYDIDQLPQLPLLAPTEAITAGGRTRAFGTRKATARRDLA